MMPGPDSCPRSCPLSSNQLILVVQGSLDARTIFQNRIVLAPLGISLENFLSIRKKTDFEVTHPHFHRLVTRLVPLLLSIYLLTYIASLQRNYSEALPVQARPKRRVLLS